MKPNSLVEKITAVQGLVIEIWSADFDHALSGHPEVSIHKIRKALSDPIKVVQSKSSRNTCLFYSIEVPTQITPLYFCVVVSVIKINVGRLITAYETNYIKDGFILFKKGAQDEY